MKNLLILTALIASAPALAQSYTQHDAHEHGIGKLNMAIAGSQLAMELTAPGADIVGFEYEATSEQDKHAVEHALAQLHAPLTLIALPTDAQCKLVMLEAYLESGEGHHDHKAEHHDDEEHHDHEEEHYDAEGGGQHTEFHAESLFECANMKALHNVAFPYFQIFPNALELEVQIVNDSGARAFEVERAEPQLEL